MAKRGGGTIVNVSSLGAGLVPDNYLVVGTSKAAVEALTRHLAIELAPLKIRVNTASCSLIEGDVAKLFPRADELEAVTVATTPLGRLATARDLVRGRHFPDFRSVELGDGTGRPRRRWGQPGQRHALAPSQIGPDPARRSAGSVAG